MGHVAPRQKVPIAGHCLVRPGRPPPTMATAPPKTFLQQLFAEPKVVAPLLWPGPGFLRRSFFEASTQPASLNFARPTTTTYRFRQNYLGHRWLQMPRQRDSTGGREWQTQDKYLDVRRPPPNRCANFYWRREADRWRFAPVLPVPNGCFTDLEYCCNIRGSQEFQILHSDQLLKVDPSEILGGFARPRSRRTGSITRRRSRASGWRAGKKLWGERIGHRAQDRFDNGTHAQFCCNDCFYGRPKNR